jgi:glycerophosphoryl diester phosphodiesterase
MALSSVFSLLFLHCSLFVALVSGCKTLQGLPPVVIARGGFSGIFPDSSLASYSLALKASSPNITLWCDVQLTKDGIGICFPDIKLDNATDITIVYPGKAKDYSVNKVPTRGWFSLDFNFNELSNVSLVQGVYSRTNKFDGSNYHISTVENVAKLVKSPSTGLWLNVQHDTFYKHHNLSVEKFLLSLSTKGVSINYISSPNVDFLRRVRSKSSFKKTVTIFRFLEQYKIEPTTNKTYGALLKHLKFIGTFASGILVPKGYIWPVDSQLYLQQHTSLVADAHKQRLKVFVSDLVNDVTFSYNFSYDPMAECLSFIDNGNFSVDGILSDFPVTPTAAINCFSGLGRNAKKQVETLIITKYGASGDYPACTDLAYKKAKSDGADVIDCPVQISKDGVPFCLSSIDLSKSTTVSDTKFRNRSAIIPEIQNGSGIYAFSLTWNEIKTLTRKRMNHVLECLSSIYDIV